MPIGTLDTSTKATAKIYVPDNPISRYLPQNPDDIYRKRNSLQLYYDMIQDPQVKAIVELKKNLILGSGWEIILPQDLDGNIIEEAKPQLVFLKENFNEVLTCSLDDAIWALLSAHEFGFSVSELIFKQERGKLWLNELKHIPADSIEFDIDDFGNYKENGFYQWTNSGRVILSPEKFVIFQWNQKDGNPYGESALRAVYKEWFIKSQVVKYWAMYLERHGFPFPVGTYSDGMERTQTAELEKVFSSMQAASSVLIPDTVKIDFKEFDQQGADSYEKAVNYFNFEISKGLLTPDLVGLSNEIKAGSFALGKKQFELLTLMNNRYRRIIEDGVMNRQVIRRLCDLNFSNIRAYPKFKFKTLKDDEQLEKIRTYLEVLKLNAFKVTEQDIVYIRDSLSIPASDVELIERKAVDPFPFGQPNGNNPKEESQEEIKEKALHFDYESGRNLIFAEKGIDFRRIDKEFNARTQEAVGKLASIIGKIKEEVLSKIKEDEILEKGKVEKAESIQIPMIGNLKTQFERLYLDLVKQGQADAIENLERKLPEDKKFSIIGNLEISRTAIKEFLKKLALTKAIQSAGKIQTDLKNAVRTTLIEGFRSGITTANIIKDLELVFSPYVEGIIIPTQSISPHRLENIVRTNANMFYNQGRLAANQEAIQKGIVTHFQYSAIMDSRVSDICESLHGTVISATDSASLSTINPPRHYNCRSTLIEITKFEQAEMQEKIRDGELKSGLKEPDSFYDGFKR